MKKLYIIGTSGTAHEIMYYAKRMGIWITMAFIGDSIDKEYKGIPIIKEEDVVWKDIESLAFGVGMNSRRRRELSFKFIVPDYPNIIDPSAIMFHNNIGYGNIISPLSYIQPDAELGAFNYIQVGTGIGHNTKISNYVSTGMGTQIGGGCDIGECVYIGSNAFVKQDLTICNNVIIGAGAVVLKDITEPGTYVGTPARKVT
jgi:sugar O-acyltransferase (sialic acid O-acetyltransferase NeuD family)